MPELTDLQHRTLRAVCDTVVPSIARAEDPDGFFARRATDVGADEALLLALDALPPEQAAGMLQLLDALAAQGFNDCQPALARAAVHQRLARLDGGRRGESRRSSG